MPENTQPEQNQPLSGEPSPEELEAAQAANEFDALTVAQAEVATLQAKNTELADSLEAGLAVKEATADQIREGAEATLKQLKSALERNKVVAIDPPAGTKFDPAQHQAISMVPADQEANTVVSVLQKGYLIAERVLRPALVTVAAPK